MSCLPGATSTGFPAAIGAVQMFALDHKIFAVALMLGWACGGASAGDDLLFRIQLKDGVVSPATISVPPDTRIKFELHNAGTSPAEFESEELHLEKVLAAGASSFLVIRRLSPGEFRFFDDFHPDVPGSALIVKVTSEP